MAELKKHVLGIPSGKVGDSVCFSTWRGKACIRSLASNVYNLNSPSQRSHRMQFGLLGALTKPLAPVLMYGFKALGQYGVKAMTPLNAFIKYNYDKDDTFTGEGPDEWEIDFTKLSVAQGGLMGFTTTNARLEPMSTDNNVIFTWESDESAEETDQVYCVLYNEDLNLGKFVVAQRADLTATVILRDEWLQNGKTHCYIFAFNGKKASSSEYLGAMSN